MNIAEALQSLRPGAQWSINSFDYEGLIWFDENELPPPTEEELQAEIERLQEEYAAKEYQRQRAPEYPDIKDQLDAIWKGGDAYEEMLARVMEVKAKYPKPE
jgi:uncharacterized coiled-coil DUF342 family protein